MTSQISISIDNVCIILTIILFVLKVAGIVSVSWWIVFTPLAIMAVIDILVLLFVRFVFRWVGRNQ